MPRAALKVCTYPGCTNLVTAGRCALHQANGGRNYPRDPAVQRLYNSTRWKRIRAAQLKEEPCCRECAKKGQRVRATEVDHIEPHKGDPIKFFAGPFQSLCHTCHTAKTNHERAEETRGA